MAQSQLYLKKAQLSVIEESTQDTYEAPTAATTVLCRNVSVTFNGGNFDPEFHRGDVLNMEETAGPLSITMTYEIPLKGSGAAGTAPETDEILKSCGLAVTNVVSTSDTYQRISLYNGTGGNPGPSYSAHMLFDGQMISLRGGFSNMEIVCDQGGVVMGRFTTMGAAPDTGEIMRAQALLSPTYDTTRALAFRGASFSTNFGGAIVPVGVTNFTLNLNNNLQMGPDANEADGYYGARIVPGGRPTGSFDAELPAVATKAWIADQRDSTTGSITTGAIGSTAGNIVTITVNEAQMRPHTFVNRNDIAAATFNYAVGSVTSSAENTAGDDIAIAFT